MEQTYRRIKSYVLRQGRLTQGQQKALERLWGVYGIDYHEATLDFDTLYDRAGPIVLEIGFGNGDSLCQQAMSDPDRNYLGIKVHRPGVGHLLRLAEEAGISNLRVINHDAVEVLQHQIPDQSVDCIQLFFPDPWHKKRHHKRRIVNAEFAQLVRNKLKSGGLFHLATDWQNYAEHMLAVMERAEGFSNTAGANAFADKTGRPLTRFEQRGQRLGHGVWDLVYRKD